MLAFLAASVNEEKQLQHKFVVVQKDDRNSYNFGRLLF